MEAAEVKDAEEAEEDEAHEEGTRCQNLGRQDSIAPIRHSAEWSVGQRQFQTATAPLHFSTG